ncbi:PPE domain-containing protein [Catenulispora subtropica]|uniref:PPE domain-containing protein n=1 Tax=Catenulispora subtropica TaxID=450798 RepID=A0ABP5EC79_9ACTN
MTVPKPGSPGHSTDFSQYSLAQLTHMLYESDPATGVNTAQTWDATGKMLHEQASNLEGRLRNFDGEWRGTASDEYKRMVTDLIAGIRKVADTSLQMRDLTYDAVDSLNKARAAMPAPVDIPTVSPATLALATQPLPIDAATPAPVAAQMQTEQAKAVAAVTAQQDAMASASAAHAQAVTVMKTLASSYVVAQNRFPPAPDAAPATPAGPAPAGGSIGPAIPTLPNGGGVLLSAPGTTALFPGQTQPGGANQTADNPLFGDMFTVGMAAAAAAAAGKFVGSASARTMAPLQPVSNGLSLASTTDPNAKKNDDKNKADQHAAADTAGVLGSRFLAGKLGKLGGSGGIGGGIGGGPGATGVDPGAAKAAADAAKNLAMAETSAVNDFAGGAMGTAAAAAAGRGGMMPMMPMSGMAGAGMGDGSNRRIPPWLVETEDVWGASSPVSPGLIGGDL